MDHASLSGALLDSWDYLPARPTIGSKFRKPLSLPPCGVYSKDYHRRSVGTLWILIAVSFPVSNIISLKEAKEELKICSRHFSLSQALVW